MKKIILFILTTFYFSFSFGQNEPLKAYFGLYLKNVFLEQARDKANQFSADFYWWVRTEVPIDSTLIEEIENFEFANSIITLFEIDEQFFDVHDDSGEEYYYIAGRVRGEFLFTPDYKYYPFDKLVLPITIESLNLDSEQFVFHADTMAYDRLTNVIGVPNDLNLATFRVLSSGFKNGERTYETNFGDPRFDSQIGFSSLTYEIVVERVSSIFILKILIPILLISLMAYITYFIPISLLQISASIGITSLLSCIALQLALSNTMPMTGYITATDKLFYLTYALITLTMILNVAEFNLDKIGKTNLALKINHIFRWAYPLIFIGVILFIIASAISYNPSGI